MSNIGRHRFTSALLSSGDRPALAAMMMVGSLFMLAFQDSLVKLISPDVSLWQYQFLRAAFNLMLLTVVSRLFWRDHRLLPRRLWAVALRSVLLASAMTLFFAGIPFLSLATVAAGIYVFPLFIAVLSGTVLGERVGPRRITAILSGFSGTLLILKPGTESFQLIGLLPIAAALCYAATILTTRKLCREESPVTLTYGAAVALLLTGSCGLLVFSGGTFAGLAADWPYLFRGWRQVGLPVVGVVVICSFLNTFANIGLSKAYQSAESSWLAPFDYCYLIFATFWSVMMWNDLPDGWSFLGMALIAGSGIFVAWRERQENRVAAASTEHV